VVAYCSDSLDIVQQSHFRDPVIRRIHPLVGAVVVLQKAQMFVGPGQLKPTRIAICH
jgi:hypothetical protein